MSSLGFAWVHLSLLGFVQVRTGSLSIIINFRLVVLHIYILKNWVCLSLLGFVQVRAGSFRFAQVRSGLLRFAWVRLDSPRFAQVHSDLLVYC